jgi:phosphoribosylaminoimidazolecarboxamide formyltransferase/IMP cyclohydrolase
VAIIKHANPCGVATGADLLSAYQRALACDPGLGLRGDRGGEPPARPAAAEAIAQVFTEVVVAPEADEDAVAVFAPRRTCACW